MPSGMMILVTEGRKWNGGAAWDTDQGQEDQQGGQVRAGPAVTVQKLLLCAGWGRRVDTSQ